MLAAARLLDAFPGDMDEAERITFLNDCARANYQAMLEAAPLANSTSSTPLEAYNKGLADGIESAAMVSEKAYGYMTAADIAKRIRALVKSPQRSET